MTPAVCAITTRPRCEQGRNAAKASLSASKNFVRKSSCYRLSLIEDVATAEDLVN